MLTFITVTVMIVLTYLAVGYLTSVVAITIHKRGSPLMNQVFNSNPEDYRGGDYGGVMFLWPLFLIATLIDWVKMLNIGPVAVAEKIVDRNKMTTIIEGKESQDG